MSKSMEFSKRSYKREVTVINKYIKKKKTPKKWKIQCAFMITTLNKLGTEMYLNLTKAICDKPTTYIKC